MNSPIAKMTVQTAPRDYATLFKAGRFNLRTLATELGLLANDDANMAFMGMPNDKQAQFVLEGLQAYDRAGGGPPQQAPQMQQVPMQQQQAPQMQQQMMQQGQQQHQQMQQQQQPTNGFHPGPFSNPQVQQQPQFAPPPQGAPAPTTPAVPAGAGKTPLKRQPRNSGQAAAEAPAPQQSQTQAPMQGDPLAGLEERILKAVKASNKEILDELEDLRKKVAITTAAVLTVGENLIDATGLQLLEMAAESDAVYQDKVTQLGKAKKKG